MFRRFLKPLLFAPLLLAAGVCSALATQDISGVSLNVTPGTPSTSEGYTYENKGSSITGFSAGATNYGLVSLANNVFVRRNNVNANQSSLWYNNGTTGTNLAGRHQDNYGQMLISNSTLLGSDNTFANSGATASTVGNIERIDFTWTLGITVTSALTFAVFERGVAGQHDGFGIAAVTAIDALGNPTAFGLLLKVAPNWGATNAVTDATYRLFRYNAGDNITATTDSATTQTQGLAGLLITATDLGLTIGTKIYGYALMGSDVTATNSAQLLDWTNATYYPTTTDGTTGGGGIDLAALNGIQFGVVPEVSALPVIVLAGAAFAGANFLRTRRARRVS